MTIRGSASSLKRNSRETCNINFVLGHYVIIISAFCIWTSARGFCVKLKQKHISPIIRPGPVDPTLCYSVGAGGAQR